ncbi:MAG: hypothetical protein E7597_01300 [Ruminococcaceae bacterium]|nr:hypothetical protein [Oscillospiraceae bacterium]
MKKLLVMLLAVSMVLTMAFSFAACGGEEETSSDASSQAPADSSKVEDPSEDSAESVETSEVSEETSEDSVASEETSEDSAASEETSEDSAASEETSEDSAASEETSEDSVVESSEAPVESSEAPVESEEPVDSSEAPVEDPEDNDPPGTGSPVVVPAGKTNYAAGAPYTVSKNLTPAAFPGDAASYFLADASGATTFDLWGDVNLTKLTDGITAAGADFGPNGSLEGVTVAFVGTNAIFEYVIDLGETKSDINSVVFCGVRDGVANKNNRGFNTATTMIYVGDTLGAWGSKLNATFSSEEIADAPLIKHQEQEDSENVENYTYTFTLDSAATGRYVRVLTSSPVYVLQFDEIMVLN